MDMKKNYMRPAARVEVADCRTDVCIKSSDDVTLEARRRHRHDADLCAPIDEQTEDATGWQHGLW